MKKIIIYLLPLLLSFSVKAESLKDEAQIQQIQKLINNDNYQEAEKKLLNLMEKAPNHKELLSLAANLYLNSGQLDKAEDYVDQALNLEPQTEKDWLLASGIYGMQAQESSVFSKLGYAKKAKNALESLLKLNPSSEEGLIGLIQYHAMAPGIAGGDEDEIPKLIERLKAVNPIRATLIESQQYFSEEEMNKGFAIIEQSLEQNPDSVELLFFKAIKLGDTQKYQSAFDIFHSIQNITLKENANSQEKSWHQQSLYQAAKVSAEHGVSLEIGKQNMYAFMDSGQTQVEEAWVRFRLGQILWQLNDKTSAVAQFKLIPSLKPDERLSKLLISYTKQHRIKL